MYLGCAGIIMAEAVFLRDVSVVMNGKTILDSVDLSVDEGESVAIIGPNGSGKTTLTKLLTGEMHPYYDTDRPSSLRMFGKGDWNIFDLRRAVGVVSADLQSRLDADTTVSELILSGFFGSSDIFRNMTVTDDMVRRAYDSAISMGIEDLFDAKIGELSLGESRRALIARALVYDPRMLVLDEPMTGLDVVMKDRFRRMFDIMTASGKSIVMVTHDLGDIPSCIDRIVGIKDGSVVLDGRADDVITSDGMSMLYGGDIDVERNNGVYSMSVRNPDRILRKV